MKKKIVVLTGAGVSAESGVSTFRDSDGLWEQHKVEDVDTDGEDHVADEVRYFLMSRPIKPREATKPDEYASNPMNIFLDIPKENIKAKAARPRMIINGGNDGTI